MKACRVSRAAFSLDAPTSARVPLVPMSRSPVRAAFPLAANVAARKTVERRIKQIGFRVLGLSKLMAAAPGMCFVKNRGDASGASVTAPANQGSRKLSANGKPKGNSLQTGKGSALRPLTRPLTGLGEVTG